MKIPVVHGMIERRVLVNYRVDPVVLGKVLPGPFRGRLVKGFGMVGICLIRLGRVRPRWVPACMGLSSENAAHRMAVEWDGEDGPRQGVYIARRDSSSRMNAWAGGRLFPGVHHHARFEVTEKDDAYSIAARSDDGASALCVKGRVAAGWPRGSIFGGLEDASAFFQAGSLGYSPGREKGKFQGLELACKTWEVRALEVESVTSSYFDDEGRFPKGAITLDCALLMCGIEHEWRERGEICCGG